MSKRLILVDVDGTLINSRQQVPDSARRVLSSAAAAGHTLLLCTGRSLPEIYPWIWDLGFSGMIGGSGAWVRVGDVVVADHRMPTADVQHMSQRFDALGVQWLWQTPTDFYPSADFLAAFAEKRDSDAHQADADADTPGTDAGAACSADTADSDWSAYAARISPFLRSGPPQSASKGTFLIPDDNPLHPNETVAPYDGRYIALTGSVEGESGLAGEILINGVTKATGLQEAAEHLGVNARDAIMFGDSPNDLAVFDAVDTAVAMGNSTESVKDAADMIVPGIDDDGLAYGFQQLGLI
ncbi:MULTISPECIES: HAD family hydrolase [unclassified Actinobaculum]|uniref:HAD family hydrolase n=1 Tax=unclassified Actinobaculum TaxID=2609299 RepID=UPI000D529686|nr:MULTISPECIES: HAD family hydrolase [unclassified Actinobaculum]AWE41775.1 hypothetical protein DDD63_02265 [Actinobaculum sp. 313]RTE50306.1 HAD family phosphatase [Actinobaculum sp. 352]